MPEENQSARKLHQKWCKVSQLYYCPYFSRALSALQQKTWRGGLDRFIPRSGARSWLAKRKITARNLSPLIYGTILMLQAALYVTGGFAVVLGILHFTFPNRFGFPALLKGPGPVPPPFRLGPYRQELSRADVLGIVYVMNHSASFVIISIGVFDLFVGEWWGGRAGTYVSAWSGAFWWLRAAAQFYVGRRPGDWFVIVFFSALGIVQLFPLLLT
jgi:hypothetical protein